MRGCRSTRLYRVCVRIMGNVATWLDWWDSSRRKWWDGEGRLDNSFVIYRDLGGWVSARVNRSGRMDRWRNDLKSFPELDGASPPSHRHEACHPHVDMKHAMYLRTKGTGIPTMNLLLFGMFKSNSQQQTGQLGTSQFGILYFNCCEPMWGRGREGHLFLEQT